MGETCAVIGERGARSASRQRANVSGFRREQSVLGDRFCAVIAPAHAQRTAWSLFPEGWNR